MFHSGADVNALCDSITSDLTSEKRRSHTANRHAEETEGKNMHDLKMSDLKNRSYSSVPVENFHAGLRRCGRGQPSDLHSATGDLDGRICRL